MSFGLSADLHARSAGLSDSSKIYIVKALAVAMWAATPVAQADIQINSSIAIIWAILLDVAAYKDWNPFIVDVTDLHPPGQIAVGTEFTLHVQFSDGTSTTSMEKVVELTAPSTGGEGNCNCSKAVLAYKYSGLVASLGVVSATRYQWLEQDVGNGGGISGPTNYRTKEAYTGLGAVLVPRAQVEDGFKRMAVALKKRAESST